MHSDRSQHLNLAGVAAIPQAASSTPPPPPAPPAGVRRRGIYIISEEQIHRALRLPDNQHVVALKVSFQRGALLVLAEGGNLPEVPPGHETPNAGDGYSYYPLQAEQTAQLDPGQLHTAILVLLDHVHLEDAAALAGRRRILQRHAPIMRTKHPEEPHFCGACIDRPDYQGETAADWPCVDYRDASAGLINWHQPDPNEEPATPGDTP